MSATDPSSAYFGKTAQAVVSRIAFRPHLALPWLLLPEAMPLHVLFETTAVRVPNTRPWFHGVVSQRGHLLPVFDLAAWAGLSIEDDSTSKIVAIGLGAQACAMFCVGAPTLLKVGQKAPSSTEDGELSPFLGNSYSSTAGRACEFEIQRWLTAVAQRVSNNAAG